MNLHLMYTASHLLGSQYHMITLACKVLKAKHGISDSRLFAAQNLYMIEQNLKIMLILSNQKEHTLVQQTSDKNELYNMRKLIMDKRPF